MPPVRTVLAATVACFLLNACSRPTVRIASGSTILCFGDSLTHGTGAEQKESYPAVLQEITGCRVINAGVPGEISAQGRLRLPQLLQRYRPDLVIICHGGNDLLQNVPENTIEQNLAAMIEECRRSGAQVILLGVPRPGVVLRCAPLYEHLSRKYGIPLEPKVLSRVLSRPQMRSDHIHPNGRGYRVIAETLAHMIVVTH
ncbi:MAG: arylesterase [Verrucomicrobia bacterium]|nr:MAG: arylesterase [Verrucomicrobiota bacterium]